ncbi:MAG: zinc-binding dehydrogenase [candidate division NC10 bacterium]|nr:zinc-binding dehydrogenase [candidate division NC10 bacterium]
MKAVVFHQQGGLEVLKYEDAPDPKAGPGEVLIRVKACGLNRLDIWVRERLPGVPLPHIQGTDVAGEIAEMGPGGEGFHIGQRVVVDPALSCGRCEYCLAGEDNLCLRFKILGYQVNGGYAELVKVPAVNCVPIPDRLPFEEAAAVPVNFLTSWHMLITRARLRAGESLLVQAAGSGIGSVAIQIAKLAGARVIATAGSDEKLKKAKELGADHGINYQKTDFPQEVLKLTNSRGVDVVFEHVGPATFEGSLKSLARGGRLVICGATTGPKADFEIRPFYTKQLSIIGSMVGTKREFLEVIRLVGEGALKPIIDNVYPLKDAAAAQKQMMDRDFFGKLILKP